MGGGTSKGQSLSNSVSALDCEEGNKAGDLGCRSSLGFSCNRPAEVDDRDWTGRELEGLYVSQHRERSFSEEVVCLIVTLTTSPPELRGWGLTAAEGTR